MDKHQFMQRAVQLAYDNVVQHNGEPFGAIVVKDGEIIGEGVNRVHSQHDPTAHAEIEAIRQATKLLKSTDLSECELYASGEPCPMCLSTMYWTHLQKVYIAYRSEEAEKVGLSSAHFYKQLALPKSERRLQFMHLKMNELANPYTAWAATKK